MNRYKYMSGYRHWLVFCYQCGTRQYCYCSQPGFVSKLGDNMIGYLDMGIDMARDRFEQRMGQYISGAIDMHTHAMRTEPPRQNPHVDTIDDFIPRNPNEPL